MMPVIGWRTEGWKHRRGGVRPSLLPTVGETGSVSKSAHSRVHARDPVKQGLGRMGVRQRARRRRKTDEGWDRVAARGLARGGKNEGPPARNGMSIGSFA